MVTTILDLLQPNELQLQAAAATGDLVVTAGAGSGKTRTLVGRYLKLLEANVPLREIIAITFTEKAAREMRTRIRRAITRWLALDPPQRAFWEEAFGDLDAARIGTIHSLCAQILRDHPVEAAQLGMMPGFGILEEGRAAVLRARAVEEALAWAADDDAASHLFAALGEYGLRTAVSTLLARRLDADAAFERLADDPLGSWTAALQSWLSDTLEEPQWHALLDALSGVRADDPADKMETARREVLAHAEAAATARRRGDWDETLAELAALRAATALGGRKSNWPGETLAMAKESMRGLRDCFDERLGPLANPRKPAAWSLDEQMAGLIRPLYATYRFTLDTYATARHRENALDFDDLEAGALALLGDADVRALWQSNVRAVLVDEFQDTNERQRQIVYALAGFDSTSAPHAQSQTGALFIVGDEKQSIYRFRGADVTVFRRVQEDVARAGGRTIALDLTFRAHRGLVDNANRLLAPILDEIAQPDHPYAVPFAPLQAHRSAPRPGITPPFVEFHLGLGQTADAGRQAAADGLATRLLELRAHEGVEWKDVALLFRASTAFAVYEDGLERAGIPFVTVAGRGFYDRYEVRSLLNALVAVADPTDDLALLGFLRSPAVGLTDATLYRMRFPHSTAGSSEPAKPRAFWSILNHPALSDILPPDQVSRAVRARELIAEMHDLAGREPVAALLKHLLDRTRYRGSLQIVEEGTRALRNVDKLLADAHKSGLVSVREFVEYVRTLRDVGAREGEAPTEAGSAVQLMTVHKAKGLEFPIVVIADAAHSGHGGTSLVRLDESLGVTIDLRDEDGRHPAAHLLAALRDAERDEAENRRLLYVAATRAQEKLLVSAHAKSSRDGTLSLSGWLKLLGQVVGLDQVAVPGDQVAVPGTPIEAQSLPLAADIGCVLYPWYEGGQETQGDAQCGTEGRGDPAPTLRVSRDLVAPLIPPPPGTPAVPPEVSADVKPRAREAQPPRHVWRVVPQTKSPRAPAWVVGSLTHVALRHWHFVDDGFETFLRPFAIEMGIVDEGQIHAAVQEAARMLRRFRVHPLWTVLDTAQRWHKVPFSISENDDPVDGIIDLLYRVGENWNIAEFKSDRLPPDVDLHTHIREKAYDVQMQRYVRAVGSQLGVAVNAVFVFLNVGNKVSIVPAW